jgi:NB-ARC domain
VATGESEQSYALRQSRAPVIWENVPQRNKNFTGRAALLDVLRSRLTGSATVVLPHALHGLGGVGKTQLAVEYAYRHQDSYDVVLWVPADQESLVPSTLAVLAPRLGIDGIPRNRVDEAAAAVLNALRRGEPYPRWLLVFDNADQPEKIRQFVPGGPGHVLVTSRNRAWAEVVDTVDVDVFSRAESLEFLSRRVPEIDAADAGRLAEELGDLPLALDQAAALLGEGTMSGEGHRVAGRGPPDGVPGRGRRRVERVGRPPPRAAAGGARPAAPVRLLRPRPDPAGVAGPRVVHPRATAA